MSLSALSRAIGILKEAQEGSGQQRVVSWGDNIMTRLLRPALDPNCSSGTRIAMLVVIGPGHLDLQEKRNALRTGVTARGIQVEYRNTQSRVSSFRLFTVRRTARFP